MSLLPRLTTVPMLDKTNYSSWASHMLLYVKGKEHGKLLVDSVLNGPFQYGTMVEPGNETTPATIRARTYTDLTDEEKIRESVDIKATHIILQGLPQDIYNLVNHNEDAKQIWDIVKLLIQGLELSLQERESKLYDDFDTFTTIPGEIIHSYYMRFAQLINDMHTIGNMKLMQMKFVYQDKGLVVPSFNPLDDLISNLNKSMAFVSTTFGPRFPQTNNQLRTSSNPRNQAIIQYGRVITDDLDAFDSDCDNVPSAKAVLMANLSSYDSNVLSEVQENLIVHETLTAELERYKEKVKLFEQRQKFDLNDIEKYIDGQLRQVIVDRNAKESKKKEDKYLDEVIDLQKKNKALDNVVYKMAQSTQTMHMLIKPQAFYDGSHKTTLGYQNPFYLSQARRKVHALYDGHTIVKTHVALYVTDTEETLELAEESRLKMLAKQNDPTLKEKKVNIAPVDYVALNKLSEHFVKHFVPQKQLSAEQAFWLLFHNPFLSNHQFHPNQF
ncbi:hypothetical protein Tco_0857200 [Tanacetum coccineum]|uniref:Uncharacterized protein n=1 Tax=Tanacetum coccineum TaxID=301880 RepID=A0ABQ5B9G3_9ASTR